MEGQKLYAFWKSDVCPYLLGGVVKRFYPDGRIEPKGMPGFRMKPLIILPDGAGEEALKRIRALKEQFITAEKDLKRDFKVQALNIVGLILCE